MIFVVSSFDPPSVMTISLGGKVWPNNPSSRARIVFASLRTGTTTLGDVARLMVEHDIRALPVVDDAGSLIGMITHRELLRFLIPHFVQRTKTGEFHAPTRSQLQRGSADPQLIPAREAMARSVLCLAEDQTLADVANLMSSKDLDRFPVVREGVVVGFLTRADVVRRLTAP